MRGLVIGCALLSSIGSAVRAEPPDLREVSARAKWLAHVDFDALRNAEVAEKIYDDWLRRQKDKDRNTQLLEKYDKNKDGKLDEAEKKAMRAQWAKRHQQRNKQLLEKYDKNKDGKLDEAENKAMRAQWAKRHQQHNKHLLNAKRLPKMMRDVFGFDAPRELRSITLYGNRLVPGNGVVIVRAKVDRQPLLLLLRKMPDHRTSPYGDHEMHTWTHKRGKRGPHTVTGCFHRPTVMVFGRDAAEVKTALDVLDGKSPGLAGGDSFLAARPPEGTILQARAVGLADAKLPFKSPIVHQSEAVSVAIGERQGDVFARGIFVAKSAEVANDIRAIVDGFIALTKLQHKSDKDLVRVLRATKVTTAQNTVTVEWHGASAEVLKLLEKARQRRPKPKQKD